MGVVGALLCCAMPAQAKAPKAFDQYDPPSVLVLTLPDPLLVETKARTSSDQVETTNGQNIIQTASPKCRPVNVNCDVDIIQNTLNNVPNRVVGSLGSVAFIIIIERPWTLYDMSDVLLSSGL